MTVQGKVNYLDTSFLDILPLQRNWHQSLANLWEMMEMKKEKSASMLFWEEVNNRSNSVKHFPEAVWKMRGHFSVGKVNSFCVCVLNDLFPCLYSYEKYPPPLPSRVGRSWIWKRTVLVTECCQKLLIRRKFQTACVCSRRVKCCRSFSVRTSCEFVWTAYWWCMTTPRPIHWEKGLTRQKWSCRTAMAPRF